MTRLTHFSRIGLVVLFTCTSPVLLMAQAPATAPPPPPADALLANATPLPEYRIGPEDALDIMVWKNPELTRSVVVRPDGRISLPLLNDIVAAGLTPMELRNVLAAGYVEFVNAAEVSVVVSAIHSFKVSVVGLVNAAGRFELGREATVLDALALAGGLTEFAKRDRIVVLRQEGKVWRRFGFDYNSAVHYDASHNFTLRPRDIVVVP